MRPPFAVAITGGIGAGKSTALAAFARLGVATASSDEIVHRLLREDPEVRGALVERFGRGILDADGRPDRAAIASVVFRDADELAFLEALLHPRVAAEYTRWREELARLDPPPALCVVEVPLLYEGRAEVRFDAVVAIVAPEELRRGRGGVPTDGRETRLLRDEEKVRRADFAYVNGGSREALEAWVTGVLEELRARASA